MPRRALSAACEIARNGMPSVLAHVADDRTSVSVKEHLDWCRPCWAEWNSLRWNAARDSLDVKELRAYLGEEFHDGLDSSWLLVEEWSLLPRETRDSVEAFYRDTPWYVYNQV